MMCGCKSALIRGTMTILILQGPRLTLGKARQWAAPLLKGELHEQPHAIRMTTSQDVPPERLTAWRNGTDFDINVLPADFEPAEVRLLISDMDSTLINIECVDEIADFTGLKPQVAAITESAMRGEIDFETSLTQRVSLLKGIPAGVLDEVYQQRLRLNPGAEILLAGLRARGIKTALVSGGFTVFTERLKTRLHLDYTLANELEIAGGHLSGKVKGSIVGAHAKAAFLSRLCEELNIEARQAIAVGDGANDLEMMRIAGLSVAYHAKPAVQAQADIALNHSGLDAILAFLP